jgi:arginine deiminase
MSSFHFSGPAPYGEIPGVADIACLAQASEFDEGVLAILHRPSSELFLTGLHPEGQLFENPVHVPLAKDHHLELERVLEAHGVRVLLVRSGLISVCSISRVPRSATS